MPHMFHGFFQHGYLTTDIEQALAVFRDRWGVERFFIFDTGDFGAPYPIKVGLAWKGGVMIELIESLGEPAPAFAGHLPGSDFTIKLHHHGFYTEDKRIYDAQCRGAEAQGFVQTGGAAATNFIDYAYFDARSALGHQLEYVLAYPDGRAFLAQTPRND